MERNVSYTLITPEISDKDYIENEINRLFDPKAKDIERKTIPDKEQFQRSAVTNYIILNPEINDEAHPLYVFFEIPIELRGYWIAVNNEAADEFVGRFRNLIEQSSSQLSGDQPIGRQDRIDPERTGQSAAA